MHTRRGVDHHSLALKVDPVAAGGQTLHLIQIGFVARIAVELMPGVNQRQGIAIAHRRAGEAAVFILRALRRQGYRQMLPVHQILTARVPPVHRSPLGGVRVMLIKGMVPAVEPHQTVWVVDPPGAGRQVIVRIPAQIQRLALCLEYLFSPGDCVSHHFHSF